MSTKKHAAHRHARPGGVQDSRARKQCEVLGARLSAVRAELLAWDEAREQATELYRTQLVPLHLSIRHTLRALVLLLDDMHRSTDLDDEERGILSEVLADTAFDLLDAAEEYGDDEDEDEKDDEEDEEEADPELSAIYERHRGADVDDAAAFKRFVSQVFGIDIGDVDLGIPEDREAVREVRAEDEEMKMERLARPQAELDQSEARLAAHTTHLRQVADALAVELKAALHGTGVVGEADRLERLQRVDDAHSQGLLAELMGLGFAFEQEGIIAHISEKRVAEFKHVLKELLQLSEQELVLGKERILFQLDLEVPPERIAALVPADLLDMMDATTDDLREELAGVERDLAELTDPRKLKVWLRRCDIYRMT